MAELKEAQRDHIDSDKFAFPKERKEPIHDAAHVRNAIARFNQVEGVHDDERDAAWRRIKTRRKSTASKSTRRAGARSDGNNGRIGSGRWSVQNGCNSGSLVKPSITPRQ